MLWSAQNFPLAQPKPVSYVVLRLLNWLPLMHSCVQLFYDPGNELVAGIEEWLCNILFEFECDDYDDDVMHEAGRNALYVNGNMKVGWAMLRYM